MDNPVKCRKVKKLLVKASFTTYEAPPNRTMLPPLWGYVRLCKGTYFFLKILTQFI
jgi:hypothetical protein